ncbi:hypothetical protein GIB67_035571 [Kingdonia uniflora]|uniref:Uncharacterized protein n=1 Tax=Kingdonia uniflora TaxID=39325 RepID=A0A7J7LDF0_9MAGN|nr:hypothetical protein GIB67_035571 [Kingdonia uniflora]
MEACDGSACMTSWLRGTNQGNCADWCKFVKRSCSAFARILLRTSSGKKHLVRPLLRTEISQVVNRRSWYDVTKLTTEVLNLYKITRVYKGKEHAEVEFTIGPIPVDDGRGKEIPTLISTTIKTNKTFYTYYNG